MNSGRTVFAQLMDFAPAREFRRCVERHHGGALRSDHSAEEFYSRTRLSRSAAAHLLCRCGNRKTSHLPDPQFSVSSADRRTSLQMPLADRIVLQVDQTTSAHRAVLRTFRERRENPSLDRQFRLRAIGGGQKTLAAGAQPLHPFPNSQRQPVRENPAGAGTYQF